MPPELYQLRNHISLRSITQKRFAKLSAVLSAHPSNLVNSCFRAFTVLREPGTTKLLNHRGSGQLKEANMTC